MTEPDERLRFTTEGESMLFGRDDDVCDIVIWSALCDPTLSRVAGRLWRMGDELWLRNLSRRHELVVSVPGRVAEPPLPPRTGPQDRGAARCLPQGTSVVLGPGGCELVVTQTGSLHETGRTPRSTLPAQRSRAARTTGLPDVPEHLWDVALALCEPLLRGLPAPATYRQVARRLGIGSYKRVRLLTGELCDRYGDAACAPHLRAGRRERERASRPLERRQVLVLVHGVWRFRPAAPAGSGGQLLDGTPAAGATAGPELPLPRYFAVAQLLVRRGLVRVDDLRRLEERGPLGDHGGPTRDSVGSEPARPASRA